MHRKNQWIPRCTTGSWTIRCRQGLPQELCTRSRRHGDSSKWRSRSARSSMDGLASCPGRNPRDGSQATNLWRQWEQVTCCPRCSAMIHRGRPQQGHSCWNVRIPARKAVDSGILHLHTLFNGALQPCRACGARAPGPKSPRAVERVDAGDGWSSAVLTVSDQRRFLGPDPLSLSHGRGPRIAGQIEGFA